MERISLTGFCPVLVVWFAHHSYKQAKLKGHMLANILTGMILTLK